VRQLLGFNEDGWVQRPAKRYCESRRAAHSGTYLLVSHAIVCSARHGSTALLQQTAAAAVCCPLRCAALLRLLLWPPQPSKGISDQ